DHDVDHAFFSLHCCIQPIQVSQACDVALDGSHVGAELRLGLVQFGLAPTRDENMGAFADEAPRRREPDAAGAARYDGTFSFKIRHDDHLCCAVTMTALVIRMPPSAALDKSRPRHITH